MVAWSMLAVEMLRLDMEVLKAAPCRFHFNWNVCFLIIEGRTVLLIDKFDNHNTVDGWAEICVDQDLRSLNVEM